MTMTPYPGLHARSVGLNQRYHLGNFKLGLPDLPPGRGASADPYAAILAALPKPYTPGQITAQARGQISPLVAALAAQIQKQTAAATHAIGGYAGDAAAKLAALDFQQPYTQAEQGQASVDAALRQALSGQGATDAAGLSQRLAVINDPSVAAAARAVGANADASGNTQLAQGSAALGNLIANAAAAGSYGEKLPGISRLAGLQGITGAQQQGQQALATGTQQLEGQLPAIVQGLQQESDQRAGARASAQQNRLARQDALAATGAKNETAVTIAQIRAKTAASAAQIRQAQSDRAYRLQFAKTFGVDPVTGRTIPGFTTNANGKVVKVSTAKTGSTVKPPTANEINNWVDGWKNGKPVTQTRLAPKPDANGNPVYRNVTTNSGQLSYQQAYDRLTAAHVPDQQARQYLDTAYKRGEQGRGWLTNEEQAALSRSKLPPRAYRYKGVGYIDPKQANALKAAGMQLPPGQWIQGSTSRQDLGPIYVIDETF